MSPLIQVKDIAKTFEMRMKGVAALRGVSFSINSGEFVAITGPSGSGKSTLLSLLGCLENSTSGTYLYKGSHTEHLPANKKALLRNKEFGFVFQNFCLLERMDVAENCALPLLYAGIHPKEGKIQVREIIQKLSLSDVADHYPSQLSGGQQQRAAIARALSSAPSVIFADEPTGNLDTKTGLEVIEILQRLNQEDKVTIILVTHDPNIVRFAKRQIVLRDGKMVEDKPILEPADAAAELKQIR